MDTTDAYQRSTVKTLQVVAFSYVILLAPGDKGCIICIDLVLPMGWVDSTKFFCLFWRTLTDVTNTLVDTDLLFLSYGAISKIPATGLGAPHTPGSLTHIYCYMDDIISAVQGGPDCQHRVFQAQYVPSSGSSCQYWGG